MTIGHSLDKLVYPLFPPQRIPTIPFLIRIMYYLITEFSKIISLLYDENNLQKIAQVYVFENMQKIIYQF